MALGSQGFVDGKAARMKDQLSCDLYRVRANKVITVDKPRRHATEKIKEPSRPDGTVARTDNFLPAFADDVLLTDSTFTS